MSLSAAVLAALLTLPTYAEDTGPELAGAKLAQLTAVADAVAEASAAQRIATSRDWAALVVAIGFHESGFSLRIHDGHCRPLECDRGRARGPWQLHRYAEAVTWWDQMQGVDNVELQAKVVSARMRRGYYTCRGATDWVSATLSGYAGRRCGSVWPGLEQRFATWRRVRKSMDVAASRPRVGG